LLILQETNPHLYGRVLFPNANDLSLKTRVWSSPAPLVLAALAVIITGYFCRSLLLLSSGKLRPPLDSTPRSSRFHQSSQCHPLPFEKSLVTDQKTLSMHLVAPSNY